MSTDLTTGSPARVIAWFTLPLLVGNVVQQLYTFVDAFVVGRFAGVDALAAVGAVGGLSFLLIGFTIGLTNGVAIPVSHAFGARDLPAMRRLVGAAIAVSVGCAVLLTAMVALARPMLQLLHTPDVLLADAIAFARITFGGALVTVGFNLLLALIRALGDSRTPLLLLAVSSAANAVLVVAFVGGLGWGVRGAGAATLAAQGLTLAVGLVLVARRMPLLRLTRHDLRVRTDELRESLRLGVPMGFQMSIIALGALVLQYAINGLGAQAVAAFTVAMRVDQLAIAPLASFGAALATYTAQNRGARQWHRVRVGVRRTTQMSVVAAVLLGATTVLTGPAICRAFVGAGQQHVVDLATTYFRVNGPLYWGVAVLFVLRNAIQGLGAAAVPTAAGVLELVGRTSAALLLVGPFGFTGVAAAAPLAWFAALVPLVLSWQRWRGRLRVEERAAITSEVRLAV